MKEVISIMDNINKKYGKDVEEDVKKMAYSSCIYILYDVCTHKITEKDLKIEFASYEKKFPGRTFEQFLRFKKDWKQDKYSFGIEEQGYFLDEETAIDYAINNIGDLNEAGAYPYVVISSRPLNVVYPNTRSNTHKLFLFNRKIDKYELINWDLNDETKHLHEAVDLFYKIKE